MRIANKLNAEDKKFIVDLLDDYLNVSDDVDWLKHKIREMRKSFTYQNMQKNKEIII